MNECDKKCGSYSAWEGTIFDNEVDLCDDHIKEWDRRCLDLENLDVAIDTARAKKKAFIVAGNGYEAGQAAEAEVRARTRASKVLFAWLDGEDEVEHLDPVVVDE